MLPKPSKIIRITLADEIPDEPGIYILAYLGKIIYVGKVETSIYHRIAGHRWNALKESFGSWLVQVADYPNIRLDILIPPDNVDFTKWMNDVERACILKFNPLFNESLTT